MEVWNWLDISFYIASKRRSCNEISIEILIIVHVTEYNINIFWVNSFMFGKFSAAERRHFSRLIKPPYVWKYVSSLLMAIWYIFWLVFVFLSFTFFIFYGYVLGFSIFIFSDRLYIFFTRKWVVWRIHGTYVMWFYERKAVLKSRVVLR